MSSGATIFQNTNEVRVKTFAMEFYFDPKYRNIPKYRSLIPGCVPLLRAQGLERAWNLFTGYVHMVLERHVRHHILAVNLNARLDVTEKADL